MTQLPPNFPLTKPSTGVADATRSINDIYAGLQTIYPQLYQRVEMMVQNGTAANQPAADGTPRLYYQTDTGVLQADVSGTWTTVGSGANPGGSATEVQYRTGAHTFGAVSGSSVSGSAVTLGSMQAAITDAGGQVFNVKAYGATGNGSTDDTTAILAAATALNNSTYGGILFFPPGIYITSATIPLVATMKNVIMRGSGHGLGYGFNAGADAGCGTEIRYTGGASPIVTLTGDASLNHPCHMRMTDLAISNPGTATIGVQIEGLMQCHLNGVFMSRWLEQGGGSPPLTRHEFSDAAVVVGRNAYCNDISMHHCQILDVGCGLKLEGVRTTFTGMNSWIFFNHNGDVILGNNSRNPLQDIRFIGCGFGTDTSSTNHSVTITNCTRALFLGGYMEQAGTGHAYYVPSSAAIAADGVVVSGMWFSATSSPTYSVYLDKAYSKVVLRDSYFLGYSNSWKPVRQTTGCSVLIEGNDIEAQPADVISDRTIGEVTCVHNYNNSPGLFPDQLGATALTLGGTIRASAFYCGANAGAYGFDYVPGTGADVNMVRFGVSGYSNGFLVQYKNSPQSMRYTFSNLVSYANNAAAIAGGLTAGMLYTVTGTNPLQVAVVY